MSRAKPLEPISTLSIKLPTRLRDELQVACRAQDTTASHVIRAAVREYLKAHSVIPTAAR